MFYNDISLIASQEGGRDGGREYRLMQRRSQEDTGGCTGDIGVCREMQENAGRCKGIQGDARECMEMQWGFKRMQWEAGWCGEDAVGMQ